LQRNEVFALASNFHLIVTSFPDFLVVTTEKILIVEDEPDVADLLAHHLKNAGFAVEIAGNGRTALNAIKNQPPTLVVLDLMLPEMSGLDLCRILKSDPTTSKIAVVMLSAKIEELDRVLGFELGADDYVVKPFSPREFVLRIRAILRRRSQGDEEELLRVGELVLDRSRHEVKAGKRLIECTATEFKLLTILMERQGRVQERDRLLSDVWGYDSVIDTRTVDTHMRRLRDKLGVFGKYIETVRGFGYRLAPQE
jgi:two-component system, OmpR family, phosphate regulon response regulator PhoB